MNENSSHVKSESQKKRPAFQATQSFFKILTGNPSEHDENFHRFQTHIKEFNYSEPIEIFAPIVQKDNEAPFKAVLIKSLNNVYTIANTVTPVPNKKTKTYDLKPSITLYACKDQHYAADICSLENGHKKFNTIDPREFNRKFSAVRTHLKEDLCLEKFDNSDSSQRYNYGWVDEAVKAHISDYERRLLTHGALIKDSDYLYRSGSSIFWLEESKKQPSHFYCYHYSNPVLGQSSLYTTEDILNKTIYKFLLKRMAIRLTSDPIPKDQTHEFVRKNFEPIANKIVRFGDSYDLNIRQKGKRRFLKKTSVRALQSITNLFVSKGIKSLLGKALLIGVSFVAIGFALNFVAAGAVATIAAISANRYGLVARIAQGAWRSVSSELKPGSNVTESFIKDYSHVMAQSDSGNWYTDDAIGLPAHPACIHQMDLVPIESTGIIFARAKSYSKEQERKWAEEKILNAKAFSPGTVFSEATEDHHPPLVREEPNGVQTSYNTSDLTAFARQHSQSFEYADIEHPLAERFKELTPDENYIAVRHSTKDGVVSMNLKTLNDIPTYFVSDRSTIKEPKEKSNDFQSTASALFLLPNKKLFHFSKSEQEKTVNKAKKDLKNLMLKNNFKETSHLIDIYCENRYSQRRRFKKNHITINTKPAHTNPR